MHTRGHAPSGASLPAGVRDDSDRGHITLSQLVVARRRWPTDAVGLVAILVAIRPSAIVCRSGRLPAAFDPPEIADDLVFDAASGVLRRPQPQLVLGGMACKGSRVQIPSAPPPNRLVPVGLLRTRGQRHTYRRAQAAGCRPSGKYSSTWAAVT